MVGECLEFFVFCIGVGEIWSTSFSSFTFTFKLLKALNSEAVELSEGRRTLRQDRNNTVGMCMMCVRCVRCDDSF